MLFSGFKKQSEKMDERERNGVVRESERTAGRNKNHDGLTTSVHSHSSMSSMTEDWPPTPYGAASRPPQVAGKQKTKKNKKKNPTPNTTEFMT